MIARNLADFYMKKRNDNLHVEFQEGTAEEVIQLVANQQARIGIIHLVKQQESVLRRILETRDLQFEVMREFELFLYVGPNSPQFNQDVIEFEELKNLKFIQGNKDYFSMVEHMDAFSLGMVRTDELEHVVHTNSDNCFFDMLLYTELCSIGVDFLNSQYQQYDISMIPINGCEGRIVIGYVTETWNKLDDNEKEYIQYLKDLLK